MKLFLFCALLAAAAPVGAEFPAAKPAPRRPPEGPQVVVESFEVLPDCAADKVCAEGLIRNIGSKIAHDVRLRIDIGGTKYGKPRTAIFRDIEKNQLDPTEAQSVGFTVDRKIPYKSEKGEDKVLEVGRFNIKMVPVWRDAPKPLARPSPKKPPVKR